MNDHSPPQRTHELRPIPRNGKPWYFIGIDLVKFPVSSSGKVYALTATDLNTKWIETAALSSKKAIEVWRNLENFFYGGANLRLFYQIKAANLMVTQ